jgi:hypothetical protein
MVPFLYKMFLLLLGFRHEALALGEIEESLRAFPIEEL